MANVSLPEAMLAALNPVPVIVTAVPPAVGPDEGDTFVTMGAGT